MFLASSVVLYFIWVCFCFSNFSNFRGKVVNSVCVCVCLLNVKAMTSWHRKTPAHYVTYKTLALAHYYSTLVAGKYVKSYNIKYEASLWPWNKQCSKILMGSYSIYFNVFTYLRTGHIYIMPVNIYNRSWTHHIYYNVVHHSDVSGTWWREMRKRNPAVDPGGPYSWKQYMMSWFN